MEWTNSSKSLEREGKKDACTLVEGKWCVKDAVMVTITNYGCPVYYLAMVEAVDDSNQAYVRIRDEWHCSGSPRCIFNRVGVFENRRGWLGNKLVFIEQS